MLAFAWQFGLGDHPTHTSLVPGFLLIAGFALGGLLLLAILEQTVPRARRRAQARRAHRRRLMAAAGAELAARAQMDELCPDGWRAQITLFSGEEDLPEDAPEPSHVRVALDWVALGPHWLGDPVVRRVWAGSVNEAFAAMVADRMTDETLQQIESQALADGAEWPESPDQPAGA